MKEEQLQKLSIDISETELKIENVLWAIKDSQNHITKLYSDLVGLREALLSMKEEQYKLKNSIMIEYVSQREKEIADMKHISVTEGQILSKELKKLILG